MKREWPNDTLDWIPKLDSIIAALYNVKRNYSSGTTVSVDVKFVTWRGAQENRRPMSALYAAQWWIAGYDN
jgi:hypothetical protein